MEGVTLTLAVIACILVFTQRPLFGLIVYIAAFTWYPTYLTLPVGTIEFTLRRIVILAIFVKLFLRTDLPLRFQFNWLDKLVIIQFAIQILVGATKTQSLMVFLENRGGELLDAIFPYFAIRMMVRNKQEYLTLLKAILIIATPLAIIGFYECITGSSPVGFFGKYYPWGAARKISGFRRAGFYRAIVTSSHPIMYGLFFAMFGPACAGLLRQAGKKKLIYVTGMAFMCIGVFSSVSSGPLLAAVFAVGFIFMYYYRRHWKIALLLIILICGMLEIINERHFYDELDRFAYSSETAWYRIRLIEVALFEGGMKDHWLTGFGWGTDPGWMKHIYPESEKRTDMVNHYLSVLRSFGLIGFLPFLAMLIVAVKKLIYSYKVSIYDSDKWLVWCLSAGLFGSTSVLLSIALWDSPLTIFYMLIGFCGVMPTIITKYRSERCFTKYENIPNVVRA